MTRHRPLTALALALVAALFLVACGNDDGDAAVGQSGNRPEAPDDTASDDTTDPDDGSDAFPVTVTADNGEVTIEARPERIVSLSPTGTEMLFAIEAGDQVVAVDDYSYYPDEAPVTDLSGYQPNVEAVLTYEPDLVVMSTEVSDVIENLELLDIPVILLDSASDFDGIYRQIEVLGAATGNVGGAAEPVAQMQSDIDEILADVPEHVAGMTYFHELDNSLYSVTSNTFIGQVYAALGLENIADAAQAESDYPQLSEEYVIEADPEVIFLADHNFGESAETVSARPGWDSIRAVQHGAIVEVDEDIASRWGPRIVDYLRTVADALAELEPAS